MSTPTRQAPAVRDQHSYLMLRENQLAQTAALRLLSGSTRHPVSLVTLFGPPGCGKSHLARHVVQEGLGRNPDLRTRILSVDELTALLHAASTTGKIRPLQHRLRSELDLLVLEDLHRLPGRRETQLQIVSLLDERQAEKRFTLLTSRRSPGEIPSVTSRLVNRCHGGVCVEMFLPEAASRARLAAHFAEAFQIPLPQPLTSLIAEKPSLSPRDLHQIVDDLRTTAQKRRTSIDEALVRDVLGRARTVRLSISDITRAVAREFVSKVADLRSAGRAHGIVVPRQVAMFLARDLLQAEYKTIGDYFGGRNHATVIHACERVREMLASDTDVAAQVARISEDLTRE